MSKPAYLWRKLAPDQREQLMAWRKHQGLPWHRPPHRTGEHTRHHVTAACYEHEPWIGSSRERMESFTEMLLAVLEASRAQVHAWCVLPNHYHLLVESGDILGLLAALGKLRGKTSFQWNGEEQLRGRQVWPFSSALEYLAGMGREFAEQTWNAYPILEYGKGWDEPEM